MSEYDERQQHSQSRVVDQGVIASEDSTVHIQQMTFHSWCPFNIGMHTLSSTDWFYRLSTYAQYKTIASRLALVSRNQESPKRYRQ